MATPAELMADVLARLANDERRTIATYANINTRPGDASLPRRLMSDVGFLIERQFDYVNTHPMHYILDDTSTPRSIQQIVIVPYGLDTDYARLTSLRAANRVVSTQTSDGVQPHPDLPDYYVSGTLDPTTLQSERKSQSLIVPMTRAVVQSNTLERGLAPHFIINRSGDILVGPPVDAQTAFVPAYNENGVFIAVESVLAIWSPDHQNQNFNDLVELPLSAFQLITLAILTAKLLAAAPTTFPRQFKDTLSDTEQGFTYVFDPTTPSGVTPFNFREQPKNPDPRLDYSASAADYLFQLAALQGTFDVGREVWRAPSRGRIVSGRDVARVAIGTTDTAGELSRLLGDYVTIAAGNRSADMQSTERPQMFIQRQRVAHTLANQAAQRAATTQAVGSATTLPSVQPINIEPHAYNFATGRWGDGNPY